MDVLLEISRLLNTGLDMESLSICVRLCEQGINPEALSSVIKELRRASDSLKKVNPAVGLKECEIEEVQGKGCSMICEELERERKRVRT
ncbi:hypothetical protein DNTS_005852 [Danionella cerebrum]|uniref:Mitotic spindle organizing protein 1 n=1 Tax=Danionella cerebrum TaxID=2873325 RepID=A0A553PXY1_9TELE|nr:hypothetical protein DNTS_005852 [Danionella translucida]